MATSRTPLLCLDDSLRIQKKKQKKTVLWSVLSLCTREEREQSKDKEQTRQVTYPLRDSSTCHVTHLKIMEHWESERQLFSSLVKPLCSWQSRKKTLPSWALEKSTKYRLYVLNSSQALLGCWAHNRVNRRVGSCLSVSRIIFNLQVCVENLLQLGYMGRMHQETPGNKCGISHGTKKK